MFACDWPVLIMNGDYAGWLETVETLVSGLAPAERDQVFGGAAARFYAIES